ncbi:MAG: O-antigen ligase family protein [Bacteroidetes bacterium]|nr:O-antigen ligase family protein [Bacteroidota bacterium]
MKIYSLIFIIVLLSFRLISDNFIFQSLSIILLGSFNFYLLHKLKFKKIFISPFLFTMSFIVLIGIFRTNKPQLSFGYTMYSGIEFMLFFLSLILHYAWIFKNKKVLFFELLFFYIILPFGVYAFLNLAFWASGINLDIQQDLSIGKALMLANIGINIDRVQFPLVSGINSFASVVGMVFFLSITYVFYSSKNRILVFSIIICLIAILFLLDSRASLLFPVFVFALVWIIRHFNFKKFLYAIPLMPIILPLLFLFVLKLLENYNIFNFMTRDTEEITSVNGRLTVWLFSLIEISNFKPIHLIGYGEYGHYISGVSKFWSYLFGRWKNSELITPHNSTLIVFFDYGYIGLLFFMLMIREIVQLIQKLWNDDDKFANALLGFILYFIFIGITESFFGMYFQNALFVFLSVVILSIFYAKYRLFQINTTKSDF